MFFRAVLKLSPEKAPLALVPALLVILLRCVGFRRRIFRVVLRLFLPAMLMAPFLAAVRRAGFLVTLRVALLLVVVRFLRVVRFFVARFFRLLLDGFSNSISFIPLYPPFLLLSVHPEG